MADVATSSPALVLGVLGRGVVAALEPVVRADDLGFTRGDGCFETARVLTGADGTSRIDNLDAHLARLARSTAALELEVDIQACAGLVQDVCQAWVRPGEAMLKIIVSRGIEVTGGAADSGQPTVVVSVRPVSADSVRQRRNGVHAVTLARGTASDAYADASWLLGGVKSLSYALNMAALREAVRRGAHDAIWISSDGFVLESPSSAVVWSTEGRLHTTPTGPTGILAGTTVQALFAGAVENAMATMTSLLAASDLPNVDGLWLVSSVRGVAQVVRLDGSDLPVDTALTARLNGWAGFASRAD